MVVQILWWFCENLTKVVHFTFQIFESSSSRNKYLSVESRESAAIIYNALTHGISLLNHGERNSDIIRHEITKKIQGEPSAKIDYISISNNTSLGEVKGEINCSVLISTAVDFDGVRLIDNISYSSD